jgi:hypothetical protein
MLTFQRTGATVSLLLATVCSAFAGGLDEAKAKAHLDAVAAGNLPVLMQDYAKDAYMEWVGGPLDGRYRGKKAIEAVWKKFIAANGGAPREVKMSTPEAYTASNGASIEAEAEYGGKSPVKVWHVLTYREGRLTTELWQVSPSIHLE